MDVIVDVVDRVRVGSGLAWCVVPGGGEKAAVVLRAAF